MLNCDRCKLYAAGQASICKSRCLKKTREDYESLDETSKMETKYVIVSGYGSYYDSHSIKLTGNFPTEKELREKYPWITEIGSHIDNLCDECIAKMLVNKEAIGGVNDVLINPFYTSCCDKLFLDDVTDYKKFYQVTLIDLFPYSSYFKIVNWNIIYEAQLRTDDDILYIREDDTFFSYTSQCVICEDCFLKNKHKMTQDSATIDSIEQIYLPSQYTLANLRDKCEIYIDFPNRGKKLSLTSHNSYDFYEIRRYQHTYYYYKSKKNNLLLKKELSLFIAKRNLYLLRKYFPISNDIISCILKYF